MTPDVDSYAADEPSILAQVRPATATPAQQVHYQNIMHLVDQTLTVCSHHDQRLNDGDLLDKANAARWRAEYIQLQRARGALGPGQVSALQDLRKHCEGLLDDNARLMIILHALNRRDAVAFTRDQATVYYDGAWWLRTGLSYRMLDPDTEVGRDFQAELGPGLAEAAEAGFAMRHWQGVA